MAKNTSILLGDYFEKYIQAQVQTGRFSSASEVVRVALRLLEQDENKKSILINELIIGEESGFVENFDPKKFLQDLHNKYIGSEL